MADLLEQGAQFLNGQRHAHMSRPVTYQRGAASVELNATIGQTTFEQTDDYGGIQRIEARDFLVQTADLVLDGEVTLPMVGDRIRETAGDSVFIYEVMAFGSEPCFRYADSYRLSLRIHTKHIATEAA